MNTTLPDALEVSGAPYAIRTDYRCALDAIAALNDVELDEREKALCVLCVLYEDPFAAAARRWNAAYGISTAVRKSAGRAGRARG